MMHYWDYGMGWWHIIGMVLFWVVIIALVVYLIKPLLAGNNQKNSSEDAAEIAKQRYARGEISKEEYQEIIDNIK